MPELAAIGTFIVGFVVGVILMASDHLFIGIIVAAAAIPVALIVWITVGERKF
jgi:hypothetical protein